MEGMGERAHGRQRQQRGWPGQPAPSLPGARATPAQPASGGGCLAQPRWAVCATGAGAHQGQTSREGEKDIWWTAGARGGTGHLGLTHTETQRGRLCTACGQRRVFCVSVLFLPLSVGAPGCPCRAPTPAPTACPPVQGFPISVKRGLSRARLAGHGPVATPVAGTSRRPPRPPPTSCIARLHRSSMELGLESDEVGMDTGLSHLCPKI